MQRDCFPLKDKVVILSQGLLKAENRFSALRRMPAARHADNVIQRKQPPVSEGFWDFFVSGTH